MYENDPIESVSWYWAVPLLVLFGTRRTTEAEPKFGAGSKSWKASSGVWAFFVLRSIEKVICDRTSIRKLSQDCLKSKKLL